MCFVGGNNGKSGLNLLHYANGRVVNLGSKTAVDVGPGVSPNLFVPHEIT